MKLRGKKNKKRDSRFKVVSAMQAKELNVF